MKAIVQTYSGKLIDVLNLKPSDIHIEDIAAGLRIPRFNAHSIVPYTVAQHSVLVSRLCDEEDALWGLLHDASEAYLGDVIGPLKATPIYEGYRDLEKRVMAVICERYGLPMVQPARVHEADMIVLATEKRDVLGHNMEWPFKLPPPGNDRIVPAVTSRLAMVAFLDRFAELWQA